MTRRARARTGNEEGIRSLANQPVSLRLASLEALGWIGRGLTLQRFQTV